MNKAGLVTVALLLMSPSRALAQDDNGLKTSGLALAILGGSSAAAGGVVLATARGTTLVPSPPYCPPEGTVCYPSSPHYVDHPDKAIGASLLAGGITSTLFGLPMLLPSGPAEREQDRGAKIAGAWMTALGASSVAGGVAAATQSNGNTPNNVAAFMVGTGVLSTAIGVPMWVSGGARLGPTRPRSVPLRSVGVGMTVLGGLGVSFGTLFLVAGRNGASEGFVTAIGTVMGVGGLAFLAVGIPCLAIGAHQVPSGVGATRTSGWRPPDVSIGPGKVSLRWAF